jgi:hypothetical protein
VTRTRTVVRRSRRASKELAIIAVRRDTKKG